MNMAVSYVACTASIANKLNSTLEFVVKKDSSAAGFDRKYLGHGSALQREREREREIEREKEREGVSVPRFFLPRAASIL